MKKIVLTLTMIGSLTAGCVTHTVHKPVELPVPDRPNLPAISGDQMQCLSSETYLTLANRQALLTQYAERLEAVLDDNNRRAEEEK